MMALGSGANVPSRLATTRVDVAGANGKIVAVFAGTVFITGNAHQRLGQARWNWI